MSRNYISSEDSAFLREVLRSYSGRAALEIGAGNCGSLVALAKLFPVAVGTDLLAPGMDDWRASGADFVVADAATCIRPGSFDLVAFNPPYLRGDAADDRATEGGEGLEVPMRFLREALRVVEPAGRVLMLLNGEARVEDFEAECADRGFVLRRVAARHMFFEELSVFEASAPPRGG